MSETAKVTKAKTFNGNILLIFIFISIRTICISIYFDIYSYISIYI